MIPEERLSTDPVTARFQHPWSGEKLVSHQWGPVQVQNPSQGVAVKLWSLRADGGVAILSSSDDADQTIFTRATEMSSISLSFDQNGSLLISFEDDSGAFLYWFDAIVGSYVFLPIVGTSPKVTLDDSRSMAQENSDVILGYIRDGVVRYRQQRDRFTIEYTPTIGGAGPALSASELLHVSMGLNLRLQWVTLD